MLRSSCSANKNERFPYAESVSISHRAASGFLNPFAVAVPVCLAALHLPHRNLRFIRHCVTLPDRRLGMLQPLCSN